MTTGSRDPTGARLRELRRAMARHRRLLAAGLAAGAVAAGVSALAPEPPPAARILVAARDLPGGQPLRTTDVTAVALPTRAVPDGALDPDTDLSGRLLAAPMRRGEPLTDMRLVGPSLVRGYAEAGEDLVAAPVRIADAGAVSLVRAGDLVDVLAAAVRADVTDPGGAAEGGAALVAAGVRVLTVPRSPGEGLSGAQPALGDGALVVLGTTRGVAAALARAAVSSRLSLTIRAD